jgi:hypothetical protein
VRDKFVVLSAVVLVPNLNPHASRLNGKGISPHQAKGIRQTILDRIDGCENSHQGHNSKGNDEYGKDGSEQIGPDGLQGYPKIFEKHANLHGLLSQLRNKSIKI